MFEYLFTIGLQQKWVKCWEMSIQVVLFQHLRRWRKRVSSYDSFTRTFYITFYITSFIGKMMFEQFKSFFFKIHKEFCNCAKHDPLLEGGPEIPCVSVHNNICSFKLLSLDIYPSKTLFSCLHSIGKWTRSF